MTTRGSSNRTMLPLVAAVLCCGLASATTRAQSTLPAMQTTSPSGTAVPSAQPPAGANFRVDWNNPTLAVSANDADLNDVLQQISRETGMRVSGMVPPQKVYGQYGPGPAEKVIASLLEGMGVNVMLVNRDSTIPAQLTLSQRNGPPSPPQPQAAEPQSQQYVPVPPAQPANVQRFNGFRPPQQVQADLNAQRSGAIGAGGNGTAAPSQNVNPTTPVDATSFGRPLPSSLPSANRPNGGSGISAGGIPPQE